MGKASLPYYYLTFVIQPASSGVAQSPESLDINMLDTVACVRHFVAPRSRAFARPHV